MARFMIRGSAMPNVVGWFKEQGVVFEALPDTDGGEGYRLFNRLRADTVQLTSITKKHAVSGFVDVKSDALAVHFAMRFADAIETKSA